MLHQCPGHHTLAYMERLMPDIPYLLSGAGIDHADTTSVVVPRFKTEKHLHTGTRGIYVGEIGLVGVSQPGRPQQSTVVVEHARTQQYLVASIVVDIAAHHTVGSHTAHDGVLLITVPAPGTFEFRTVELPGIDHHELIGSATGQDIGGLSIEKGHAYLVTVAADEIAVAEVTFGPVNPGYLTAGHSVEYRKILFTGIDPPLGIALHVVGSGFQSHFGLSVAIEIVDHIGRIPDTGLDTLPPDLSTTRRYRR